MDQEHLLEPLSQIALSERREDERDIAGLADLIHDREKQAALRLTRRFLVAVSAMATEAINTATDSGTDGCRTEITLNSKTIYSQ